MSKPYQRPPHNWFAKFRGAATGWIDGIGGQHSFLVHLPVAAAVVITAALLRVTLVQWSLLIICISIVLAAELMNSSLELLARIASETHDSRIQSALNIASAAVLTVSIGAACVGLLTFLPAIVELF